MEYTHTPGSSNPTQVPTHSKNRPTLIAHDLRSHVSEDVVYDSLFHRGVFKLFYVREQAWKLVNMWLLIGKEAGMGAHNHSAEYWRGYRQCAMDDRAELKRLLEKPKDECLPNDKELHEYIEKKCRGG